MWQPYLSHFVTQLWLSYGYKRGRDSEFCAIPTSSMPATQLKMVKWNLGQETLTRLLLQGHSCGLDLLGKKFKLSGEVCPDSGHLKCKGAFLWTWTIHIDTSRLIEIVFKLGSVCKGNPTKIARLKLFFWPVALWNLLKNSFHFVSP